MEPTNIFKTYGPGVSTARDDIAYSYNSHELRKTVLEFCKNYNAELDRYKRSKARPRGQALDLFLDYSKVKWSRDLKKDLQRGVDAEFDKHRIRSALYRPFVKRSLYLADLVNDSPGLSATFFPNERAEQENRVIATSDLAYRSESISALVSKCPMDLHVCASADGHQCFSFYIYESDGNTRHENITNWALDHFRKRYGDDEITKWDIFHYVYAVLHHPNYRSKYAENLKRELPRIPLAKEFWGFAEAGKELARLHVDYEKLKPYELTFKENRSKPLSYRIEDKMRTSKDRKSLKVNDTLTLTGIPPETFEYRLGNRSALEWVVDQYRVKEDKRSGIRSDPNRADDPEYIVRLLGQVIYVSLETVRIVNSLPAL